MSSRYRSRKRRKTWILVRNSNHEIPFSSLFLHIKYTQTLPEENLRSHLVSEPNVKSRTSGYITVFFNKTTCSSLQCKPETGQIIGTHPPRFQYTMKEHEQEVLLYPISSLAKWALACPPQVPCNLHNPPLPRASSASLKSSFTVQTVNGLLSAGPRFLCQYTIPSKT